MKKTLIFVYLLLYVSSFELWSQTNQDCLGSIAICQTIFAESNAYSGTGDVANEINSATSCLQSGEKNDVWYTFTVQTSGSLCFTITPNLASDDYDWAVFNLSSASCSDIFGNSSLEIACNYDPTPGATGPNGLSGNQNEACMTVVADEIYVVNVSQFSPSPNGYTIDFSASSASIFDNTAPAIDSVTNTISCGETNINFKFTESVLCSTIDDADFTLSGPGGPFTISGVAGAACTGGATQDIEFSATFSPAISSGGSYSLCLTGSSGITDLCGNVSPSTCLTFTVAGLTISTVSTTDVICFGGSNGAATVSATGGTGTMTYNWATVPVQSGATATGLSGGTYAVTATDANGCSGSGDVTISTPVVIPDKFDLTCDSAGCDGSASVTPVGGTSPYSYQWTDELFAPLAGETSSTISNLCAGAWCVITTDAASCADTTCVSIILPSFVITPSLTSCIGYCDGIATLTANGGTPPFTYQWENPLGTPIVGETDSVMDSLCAGMYYLTVLTGNACTLLDSVEITGPLSVDANINTYKDACFGVCDGSATVTTTGGTAPYTYTWNDSTAQTTAIATGLCQGTYQVLVTDVFGCGPDTANVTLVENPLIITTTNVVNQSCDSVDGSATANPSGGTAPYSYLWDNVGSSTLSNAIGLYAASWTVVVTDSVGCTDTSTVLVGFTDSAEGMINVVQAITCKGACDGELSVSDLNGDSLFNQTWSTKETSQGIDSLCTDTISVTGYDSSNCPVLLTYILTEPDSITATITPTNETACNSQDGTITVVPSGGTLPYTYTWSPSVSTTALASNLTVGTYSVTIDDANNCPSNTQSTSLVKTDSITSTITPTDETSCNSQDGTITVVPSGGTSPYTYTWSQTVSTTATASNLSAGTYSVTIDDANNCPSDSQTTSLTAPDGIVADVVATDVTCFGYTDGTADASIISGGAQPYTFTWDVSGTLSETDATSLNSVLATGTYTVSITDINDCPTTSMDVTITEPEIINTTLAVGCLDGEGFLTASTQGGTESYDYIWSNGSIFEDLSALEPGIYDVTVTDINNCPPDEESIEVLACEVEIPTAFTPNGDGENDLWDLKNLQYFADAEIKIYNRWGDLVYSSTGYENPWDGKHRLTGTNLPTAVYYYIIENVDTEFLVSGSTLVGAVTIVRP